MLGDGSQAIPLGSQTRPGQARVPYIYLLPTYLGTYLGTDLLPPAS